MNRAAPPRLTRCARALQQHRGRARARRSLGPVSFLPRPALPQTAAPGSWRWKTFAAPSRTSGTTLPVSAQDADFETPGASSSSVSSNRSLGDIATARADYARVIDSDPTGPFARAARLNRARIDFESGAFAEGAGRV